MIATVKTKLYLLFRSNRSRKNNGFGVFHLEKECSLFICSHFDSVLFILHDSRKSNRLRELGSWSCWSVIWTRHRYSIFSVGNSFTRCQPRYVSDFHRTRG